MENLVLSNNMVGNIKKTLIEGLEVAAGSKSSATYYHGRSEQVDAVKRQVSKMYNLSKELPLILANQRGATGMFISEVLLNEFKNTQKGGACNIINPIDWYDNGLGDKALLLALENMNIDSGIPYVLRLFVELKKNKINNERSRKITLGYIWGHSNLEFNVMKYRNKIANILKHVYGAKRTSILLSIARKQVERDSDVTVLTEKEAAILNDLVLRYSTLNAIKLLKILLFIFKEDEGVDYNVEMFPLLSEYVKAKTNVKGIKNVPEEVLVGLISNKNHPQYEELWSTKEKRVETKKMFRENVQVTSVNQQVRQTKSTAKLGVQKTVDLQRVTDYLALYKTGYENGFTEELRESIDKLAEKKKIENFVYKSIGVLLDNSVSMTGHKQESKNTPKAVADFTAKVLGKSVENSKLVKTYDRFTDLGTSFVELLKEEGETPYEAIFILTDGYENMYDGLLGEIVDVYKRETERDIPIFQISPITGAEMDGKVRKMGESVVTMAINNPVAIQAQISTRLLEIDAKRWLENQVLAIESSSVTRKKITNNA